MIPNNSQLNLTTDNNADFIFKKGNYINTYIVIQTSGLPNDVTLNLLDENSKQLYSPYDTNGNKRTTQCYITVGQTDVIPLPANFNNNLSSYTDFSAGTYNWKLKFNGNNQYNEKILPLTVEIRDFKTQDFLTPSIYPNEALQLKVRTYVDTIPLSANIDNDLVTDNVSYDEVAGVIYYPPSDIDVSLGNHQLVLNQAKNYVFNYEVKNPVIFYMNTNLSTYQSSGERKIGFQVQSDCSLRDDTSKALQITINNSTFYTNFNNTVGYLNNNGGRTQGYNNNLFIPNTYYCTVSAPLNNGERYTCESSFIITTENCSIDLSFNYDNDNDILTSTYLYDNSTPLPNALMGLVNARTNNLITTATTDSNGQIQWTVGDGVYKVVAINVDNQRILTSSEIDLTSEYTLITDISLNENHDALIIQSIPSISLTETIDLVTDVSLDDNGNIIIVKETFNPGDNTDNVISNVYMDNNGRIIAETYNIYTDDILLTFSKDIIQKNENTKLIVTVLDKNNKIVLPNQTVNFYDEYDPAINLNGEHNIIQAGDELVLKVKLYDLRDGSLIPNETIDISYDINDENY